MLNTQGTDQFDCMSLISKGQADLLSLDPGMGYTGGQFYNLMPILAEQYRSSLYSKCITIQL